MNAGLWVGLAAACLVPGAAWSAPAAEPPAAVPQDPIVTNDPAFMATFGEQYKQAFGEGAIPAKYKQLSGVTLSVVVKCEDCLRYHVQMAIRLGATRPEIVEALRIGLLTGGSAGMPAMGAAYAVMDEAKLK
jgi:AhpD family alkylhydroperoxidase